MTRFNSTITNPRKVQNFEGGEAYTLTPELDLYTKVCTASLQNKFYSEASDDLGSIRDLLKHVDPLLVCKLAVYAREKMYLRSIPLVLMVELLKNLNEQKTQNRDGALLRKIVSRVIQRADEITEILAYFADAHGKKDVKKLSKMPNALKRGVADSFYKFDEYQLAKYNANKSVKLRDALFLFRPKPRNDKEKELFKKLAENKLDVPYTWEVELSALGQQKFENEGMRKVAFSNKWMELVDSKALGYMALMRNLRNFVQSNISKETIRKVCEQLSDEQQVMKSKQLPFRFFAAYKELSKVEEEVDTFAVKEIKKSLETAVKLAVQNIKGFDVDTRVLIACDVSGSMQTPISPKSSIENYEIGLLLGQILQSKCKNVVTGFFGDTWKVTDFAESNVLANTLNLRKREGEVGYSTNGYLVLDWLNNKNTEVDKIMIFTDCQLWNSNNGRDSLQSEWTKYKQKFPKAKLYLFDLAGYGTSPLDLIRDKNVAQIAGWSEKIFEVLDAVENGETVLDFVNGMKL